MLQEYSISVDERTLRNWCSRLIACGYIAKSPRETYWKTTIVEGVKRQIQVEPGDAEMARYFERRGQLIRASTATHRSEGLALKEASSKAWKETMSELWAEFDGCYYSCAGFDLTAFDGEDFDCLCEIYELTEEIIATVAAVPPKENEIKTEEDFHAQFYTQKQL